MFNKLFRIRRVACFPYLRLSISPPPQPLRGSNSSLQRLIPTYGATMARVLGSFIAAVCLSVQAVSASPAHWSYRGDQGPDHWGELGDKLCSTGQMQSPVNIDWREVTSRSVDSDALRVDYQVLPMEVLNNGHSIQAKPMGETGLSYMGRHYRLMQFHFHTPSEHQFDQREYPMEMHLVHQADDGGLLVLGVMIEQGEANDELADLWDVLPEEEGGEARLGLLMAPQLQRLLPATGHHLFYDGSLTTPPCTEGVKWVLYEQPIQLSASQIQRFRELFPDNHRPARALDGREVDED
nr:carbonic anhydrase family protein [Pseudomonas sp. A46]